MGGFANYLLPVQVGAPDMAKNKCFSTKNDKLRTGHYLAGLIEGDGYISIITNSKILIGITFNIWDKPVALKLISILGQGNIVKRPGNSIELRFTSKTAILAVINLINGKFRTPKIGALSAAIRFINSRYGINIKDLGLDSSDIKSNAWLAGFIDADGGFQIRHSKNSRMCKFALEQRMTFPSTGHSYKPILSEICSFLQVNLGIRNRIKASYYIIRVENQKSLFILINYLKKYPLYTHRYLDFLSFCAAFDIVVSKNHFTVEGGELLLSHKNEMNNNRTNFTWDHLCRFSP